MKKVFKFIPCLLGFGALIGCGGNNPTLVGIDASFVDNVNRFMVGDTLSKNKIKVVANYSNSTKKEVTDWTCEEFKDKETYTFSETDVTKNKFTIAYSNKTTDLNITVTNSLGIDWLGDIIEIEEGVKTSCYELAKTSSEIYFGTPEKYASAIEGLTAYPCGENSVLDKINLYYDNRTETIKMYVLSDDKIVFRNNDRKDSQYDGIFGNCSNAKIIKLNNVDTSRLTLMNYMFYMCGNLEEIDISELNTVNATTMRNMFCRCYKLKTIDLSNFNTSKVTSMRYMFFMCENLERLDLSTFDTSNVTVMINMFNQCKNLTTIYTSNKFDTSKCTDSTNMFYVCTKLKGENGTTYDMNHVDATYAHIDTADNPGYFTEKQTLVHDGEWYSYKKEGAVAKGITCKFIATRDSNHNFTYFGMSNYAGTTPYFNIGYQDATKKVNVLSISKDDGDTITPLTFGTKESADAYKYGNDLIVFNSSLFPVGYKIIIECTITTALDTGLWAYVGSYN